MSQERSDRRGEEGLHSAGNRVALFLDYENIRRSMEHHFSPAPSSELLCEKLHELATRFGRVTIANAYSDWSMADANAREFRRRQIEPRLVLTKESGDDRTDISMSLDALETLYSKPEIDVYIIASGDSDFHDLLIRLRRGGRRVVVVGARSDTGSELIRGADKFVPLEELLGLRSTRETQQLDWDAYDWTAFIRLIRDLSKKLNFVGLRYVATKVLNPHNCGLSDRSLKQELLNRAIDNEVIVPYQVENIEEGGEPVSACRLNQEHALVAQVLAEYEEEERAASDLEASTEAPIGETSDESSEPATAAPPPAPSRTYHSSVGGDDLGRPGEA